MALVEVGDATERAELERRARSIYQTPRTIDKERYTSRDFLDREISAMWRHVWQMVCRESEVRNVGDYLEYRIANESILIVRDAPDHISAVTNVCRHRATHLKSGCGNARELRCPFHGWKYGLDGQLLEIPNDWDFPYLDREANCLPSYKVETWQGFVFINMDPEAAPLAEHLGPLVGLFEPFHLENYVRVFSIRTVLPCNWKLNIEAFIESYHAPWTHPQTITYANDVETDYAVLGDHGRMIVPMVPSPHLNPQLSPDEFVEEYMTDNRALDIDQVRAEMANGASARQALAIVKRRQAAEQGVDTSYMSDSHVLDPWQYNIFPNWVCFTGLGGVGVYTRFLPNGMDPDSSFFEVNMMRPLVEGEEPPADAETVFWPDPTTLVDGFNGNPLGIVFTQDLSNLQTIQQGLKSRYFDGVQLGLYQEARVRHMEDVLDTYLQRYS